MPPKPLNPLVYTTMKITAIRSADANTSIPKIIGIGKIKFGAFSFQSVRCKKGMFVLSKSLFDLTCLVRIIRFKNVFGCCETTWFGWIVIIEHALAWLTGLDPPTVLGPLLAAAPLGLLLAQLACEVPPLKQLRPVLLVPGTVWIDWQVGSVHDPWFCCT